MSGEAADGAEGSENADDALVDVEMLHANPTNTSASGELLVHTTPESYLDLVSALKEDGYGFLVDLCVVDYLTHPGRIDLPVGVNGERFEVVTHLLDPATRRRVRVRVQVPAETAPTEDADNASPLGPSVPSLFDHFPGSEAMEREAFDLFGITFENHPDMTRILMPENWEGHPLRKDYGIGSIPVQFKSSNAGR